MHTSTLTDLSLDIPDATYTRNTIHDTRYTIHCKALNAPRLDYALKNHQITPRIMCILNTAKPNSKPAAQEHLQYINNTTLYPDHYSCSENPQSAYARYSLHRFPVPSSSSKLSYTPYPLRFHCCTEVHSSATHIVKVCRRRNTKLVAETVSNGF
jgi:hypothetical protein